MQSLALLEGARLQLLHVIEVPVPPFVQGLRLGTDGLGLESQVVGPLPGRLPGLPRLLQAQAQILAAAHPGLALPAQSLHVPGRLLPAGAGLGQHFLFRRELGFHVAAFGADGDGALPGLLLPGAGGTELGLQRSGTAVLLRELSLRLRQRRFTRVAPLAIIVEASLAIPHLPLQARERVRLGLDFLLPGEHAGFLVASPGDTNPARPDPHALGRHQRLVRGQVPALGQRL